MKVHPAPIRRNITVYYEPNANGVNCRQKKLRQLPHIFANVLELPFYSDADVSIEETSESLKFVVDTDDDIGTDTAAHTIETYPGVIKLVVEGTRGVNDVINHANLVNELELDVWRFWLPPLTKTELATTSFSDGELVVVVVSKDVNNREDWGEGSGIWQCSTTVKSSVGRNHVEKSRGHGE